MLAHKEWWSSFPGQNVAQFGDFLSPSVYPSALVKFAALRLRPTIGIEVPERTLESRSLGIAAALTTDHTDLHGYREIQFVILRRSGGSVAFF